MEYFNSAGASGPLKLWAEDAREEVFALQEFELRDSKGEKTRAAPRFKSLNDTSLYMGAMSLLKALAYELTAVGDRRAKEGERLAYQFNLIQMLDGDLYEASFATGEPQVRPVDRYRYFARTMLNGKEHSARIDFCTRSALPKLLQDLGALHRFNVSHFNGKHAHFYETLLCTKARLDALLPLVEPRLTHLFTTFLPKMPKPRPGWVKVAYGEAENTLTVELNCMGSIEDVRANQYFIRFATDAIREVYKFSGTVEFNDDIPF